MTDHLPELWTGVLEALFSQAEGLKPGKHIDVKEAAQQADMDWREFSAVVDDLAREGFVDGSEEGKSVLHGDDGVFFVRGLTLRGRQAIGR